MIYHLLCLWKLLDLAVLNAGVDISMEKSSGTQRSILHFLQSLIGDGAENMGEDLLERMKLNWFWHLRLVHVFLFCAAEQCRLWFPWVFKCKQTNQPINKHSEPRGATERLINTTTMREIAGTEKCTTVTISNIINRKSTGRRHSAALSVWWIHSL